MGTIADRLKEERKRLGATQEDFFTALGVTKRPYIDYEAGRTSPSAAQLETLFRLGADVQYIVTGIRSDMALTPDEHELLALFRAAPLLGKAAAIGALKGMASGPVQRIEKNKGQITQTGSITVTKGVRGKK